MMDSKLNYEKFEFKGMERDSNWHDNEDTQNINVEGKQQLADGSEQMDGTPPIKVITSTTDPSSAYENVTPPLPLLENLDPLVPPLISPSRGGKAHLLTSPGSGCNMGSSDLRNILTGRGSGLRGRVSRGRGKPHGVSGRGKGLYRNGNSTERAAVADDSLELGEGIGIDIDMFDPGNRERLRQISIGIGMVLDKNEKGQMSGEFDCDKDTREDRDLELERRDRDVDRNDRDADRNDFDTTRGVGRDSTKRGSYLAREDADRRRRGRGSDRGVLSRGARRSSDRALSNIDGVRNQYEDGLNMDKMRNSDGRGRDSYRGGKEFDRGGRGAVYLNRGILGSARRGINSIGGRRGSDREVMNSTEGEMDESQRDFFEFDRDRSDDRRDGNNGQRMHSESNRQRRERFDDNESWENDVGQGDYGREEQGGSYADRGNNAGRRSPNLNRSLERDCSSIDRHKPLIRGRGKYHKNLSSRQLDNNHFDDIGNDDLPVNRGGTRDSNYQKGSDRSERDYRIQASRKTQRMSEQLRGSNRPESIEHRRSRERQFYSGSRERQGSQEFYEGDNNRDGREHQGNRRSRQRLGSRERQLSREHNRGRNRIETREHQRSREPHSGRNQGGSKDHDSRESHGTRSHRGSRDSANQRISRKSESWDAPGEKRNRQIASPQPHDSSKRRRLNRNDAGKFGPRTPPPPIESRERIHPELTVTQSISQASSFDDMQAQAGGNITLSHLNPQYPEDELQLPVGRMPTNQMSRYNPVEATASYPRPMPIFPDGMFSSINMFQRPPPPINQPSINFGGLPLYQPPMSVGHFPMPGAYGNNNGGSLVPPVRNPIIGSIVGSVNNEVSKRFPVVWSGAMVLKNSAFVSSMYLVSGSVPLVDALLRDPSSPDCPVLKISQRLRLDEPLKLHELERRIASSGRNGCSVLLAAPAAAQVGSLKLYSFRGAKLPLNPSTISCHH